MKAICALCGEEFGPLAECFTSTGDVTKFVLGAVPFEEIQRGCGRCAKTAKGPVVSMGFHGVEGNEETLEGFVQLENADRL